MHLALATQTPLVSLFTAAIDPEWRLTPGGGNFSLVSATASVDDVAPQAIADAAVSVLSALGQPGRSLP